MRVLEDKWIYSPGDLWAQLSCEHRIALSKAEHSGLLELDLQAEPDPLAELVQRAGLDHESRILAALIAEHGAGAVHTCPDPASYDRAGLREADDATRAAIDAGYHVIYQPTFFDGLFYGRADFLIRVPGDDGRAGYEPHDAKLSRSVKNQALLQVIAYGAQLSRFGLPDPEHVHLLLGDGQTFTASFAELLPLLESARQRLAQSLSVPAELPEPIWGARNRECPICPYSAHCAAGRAAARDLSLVAGIRADQRLKLIEAGVATIDQLATAADAPETMRPASFETLRDQAAVQVKTEADGDVASRVHSADGFAALPQPSPADVFFDMEGDPFANGGDGLEYLFGAITNDTGTGTGQFRTFWAHSRSEEKRAFEQFIDWVTARWTSAPDMHVYHYANYERAALTRLAGQYGTREYEVDQLLRHGILVDLHKVVKRSVRVGQPSYSIKMLEPLYGITRAGDVVAAASDSIVDYEQFLAKTSSGETEAAQQILQAIADYNEVDCRSTLRLRDWLIGQRDTAIANGTIKPLAPRLPAAAAPEPANAGDEDAESGDGDRTRSVAEQLADGLPEDPADFDADQLARAVLAASIGYHQREHKPWWWEHFSRLGSAEDDLHRDDSVIVATAVTSGEWEPKRTRTHRTIDFHYDPDQVVKFDTGAGVLFVLYRPVDALNTEAASRADPGSAVAIEVKPVSNALGHVRLTESVRIGLEPSGLPFALSDGPPPRTDGIKAALERLGQRVLASGRSTPPDCGLDVASRRPPRLSSGSALPAVVGSDGNLDAAASVIAALRDLDRSYVAVQGPPGTGKTILAATVIRDLVRDGWRIAVTGQSHKVIENVLDKAIEAGVPEAVVAKDKPSDGARQRPWATNDLEKWLASQAPRNGGYLIGGTAWTFTRKGMQAITQLDLLIVDEAGQFSLADTLAASTIARNLLLVGDPRQLPQVSQGRHPFPCQVSALSWLMGEAAVVPEGLGYFLDRTWRLHPLLCEPVSRLAYDGQLNSRPEASQRSLDGVQPGLHPVAVAHEGCSTLSPTEAESAVNLVRSVLGKPWRARAGGEPRPLGAGDVLIVAPYNRQVYAIRHALSAAGLAEVRVGTVDKFQGQEAPVVIMSMTASSAGEIPRGLDFLLSRNRLNVAISRAQWATYLVYSPALTRVVPADLASTLALAGFLRLVAG